MRQTGVSDWQTCEVTRQNGRTDASTWRVKMATFEMFCQNDGFEDLCRELTDVCAVAGVDAPLSVEVPVDVAVVVG